MCWNRNLRNSVGSTNAYETLVQAITSNNRSTFREWSPEGDLSLNSATSYYEFRLASIVFPTVDREGLDFAIDTCNYSVPFSLREVPFAFRATKKGGDGAQRRTLRAPPPKLQRFTEGQNAIAREPEANRAP
jgi:hypothetical protein